MPKSTADLYDHHGDELQSVTTQFRQFGGRTQFSGVIRTVKVRADNALVRAVLSTPGNGRVLVVDGDGWLGSALVGDVIAGLAHTNGWSGLLIFGVVRDSLALARIDLGIKALGTNPQRSAKHGAGETDVAVTFGDVEFHPGQWLSSDEDGIVVSGRPLD